MTAVIWSRENDGLSTSLAGLLESVLPVEEIRSSSCLDDLRDILMESRFKDSLVVLLPADCQDLKDLQSLKDLLERVRIILVAPDRDAETVALAHGLRPRYLGYRDGPLWDVVAVMTKMLEKMDRTDAPQAGAREV